MHYHVAVLPIIMILSCKFRVTLPYLSLISVNESIHEWINRVVQEIFEIHQKWPICLPKSGAIVIVRHCNVPAIFVDDREPRSFKPLLAFVNIIALQVVFPDRDAPAADSAITIRSFYVFIPFPEPIPVCDEPPARFDSRSTTRPSFSPPKATRTISVRNAR